jgi:DNA primase
LIAKINITKDEILSKVSEEDIFRKYSDFEEIELLFFSPFNEERTPSCIVYKNMYFNDFSSGRKGSCFDLVMFKYNVLFVEALNIIANDFKLFNLNLNSNPIIFGVQPRQYIKKETIIAIKSKVFTNEAIKYWEQYCISKKSLNKYYIQQLDYNWIDNCRFKVNDLGFSYYFGNNKYNLMFPERSKEEKWFSNTNSSDIQGYNQLPKNGDLLIITSSLKDIACLDENYNLNCIAGKSETTLIPELQMSILSERFKDIIVYLNNDTAGINASKNYEEVYGFKWIVNPVELKKDPSDVIKNNDKDKLTEFLKQKQII